jgi:hypothetical protein
MGIGDERLRRTIELNRCLSPATGRVPVHPFPQGKFKQGKTPRVHKGKVHHLNRASICEAVFTDTFETGDSRFKLVSVNTASVGRRDPFTLPHSSWLGIR